MNTDPDRPDVAREAAHAVAPPRSNGSTKALVGVLLAGTAGMIIFLFVHLSKDGVRPGLTRAHAGCTKGQRDCLPEVSYVDTTGMTYTHDSLAGKVVLVNFWATWCAPCQKEIPDLSRAYDKYKSKGVVFLGVITDNPDNQTLLNFQSDHDMTYPVVRSSYELMSSFNSPDALPTTFVYDRTGKQVLSRIGPLRESELDSLLSPLIAQQ